MQALSERDQPGGLPGRSRVCDRYRSYVCRLEFMKGSIMAKEESYRAKTIQLFLHDGECSGRGVSRYRLTTRVDDIRSLIGKFPEFLFISKNIYLFSDILTWSSLKVKLFSIKQFSRFWISHVREFLTTNNNIVMPDMAPCDFFFFPKIQRTKMKGQCFAAFGKSAKRTKVCTKRYVSEGFWGLKMLA